MAEATPETQAPAPAEGAAAAPQSTDSMELLYDVPVTVQVQLGEGTLTVGEILKCGKGSVIKLNQKIGDPFKIWLEGKPLAEGEIVEAGDHLGIKINTILK